MYKVTRGIVLRETKYKESDKILTVLTQNEGKMTVLARGARGKKSKIGAASQLMAYSDMTMFERAGKWMMTDASTIELFEGTQKDIESFALGTYFLELTEFVSDEDSPNPEILSLLLNTLYVLSREMRSKALIKAVFELRMMCLSGFAPMLERCEICGKYDEKNAFHIHGGTLRCADHSKGELSCMPLCKDSLAAMRYIVNAESRKIFSFQLSKEAEKRLSEVCEAYVYAQLERRFKTLDFYKSIQLLSTEK